MVRYKPIEAARISWRLIPSTFENAVNHLIDYEFDLSGCDARFYNDVTALPPS